MSPPLRRSLVALALLLVLPGRAAIGEDTIPNIELGIKGRGWGGPDLLFAHTANPPKPPPLGPGGSGLFVDPVLDITRGVLPPLGDPLELPIAPLDDQSPIRIYVQPVPAPGAIGFFFVAWSAGRRSRRRRR